MRGIETPITKIRRQVFTEVAKVAFESENINDDIEAIPYRITHLMYHCTVTVFTASARSQVRECVWLWVCLFDRKVSRYILPVD